MSITCRNRDYIASIGVWARRDPLGYLDADNFYLVLHSGPINANDPFGLATSCQPSVPVFGPDTHGPAPEDPCFYIEVNTAPQTSGNMSGGSCPSGTCSWSLNFGYTFRIQPQMIGNPTCARRNLERFEHWHTLPGGALHIQQHSSGTSGVDYESSSFSHGMMTVTGAAPCGGETSVSSIWLSDEGTQVSFKVTMRCNACPTDPCTRNPGGTTGGVVPGTSLPTGPSTPGWPRPGRGECGQPLEPPDSNLQMQSSIRN